MRKFKEHKVAYATIADKALAELSDSVIDYLYDNFDFTIINNEESNDYCDRSDEIMIYPNNIYCFSILDKDLEIACFSVDNNKYVMMTIFDENFYYTGSSVEEFEKDFQSILRNYEENTASMTYPLDESCIKKLNEFQMNLATFDIGEDFIEVCEKQNIKDFKGITNILKQVFDSRNKKQ